MAWKQALALSILVSLQILTSSSVKSAMAAATEGKIAVYWGQNPQDGTLSDTCDSELYDTVLLAFLNVFGHGRTPQLNLGNHCSGDDCTGLAEDIKRCQDDGVKVFLSLGGPFKTYSLGSASEAKELADYLYKYFLSNQAGGLLGTVALDGIDFHIEEGPTANLHWNELAKELDGRRTQQHLGYSLSASPHCGFPDLYLDTAIKTKVFDQLLVQFYNNPSCQYSEGNPDLLKNSWNDWTKSVKKSTSVFLNLPAAPYAATGGGYITSDQLNSAVLSSYAKKTSNYGGVALWDRGYDVEASYSSEIKPHVANNASAAPKPALHRFIPKKASSIIQEYYYI